MLQNNMFRIGLCTLVITALSFGQLERWKYEYNGGAGDAAYDVVYTQDNYICATGQTFNSGYEQDMMLVGIDTLGNQAWDPLYFGGPYTDIAYDLSCSVDNNLYVAGSRTLVPDEDFDFIILAATSTGTPTWYYQYDYASSYDEAYSVVQGLDNNVYAAGYNCEGNWTEGYDFDFIVISLTNGGNQRWVYQYTDGGFQPWRSDVATDIVYGDDNNIYAAGNISNDTLGTQSYDLAIVSLTPSGTQRWVYIYNGPADNMEYANSLVYQNGKIYAAGYSYGTGTSYDLIVVCVNNLGQQQWVYRYNGPANGIDEARKIIYGDDNNLYVAGYSVGSGTGNDFIVIKLDTLGNEKWVYRKNDSSNGQDKANSLSYGQNRIYACGFLYNGSTARDAFTVISLDTLGNEKWEYLYDGAASGYDQARAIVFGNDRNIYAAGEAAEVGQFNIDFTVISLRDTTLVDVEERPVSSARPGRFDLVVMPTDKGNLTFFFSSPVSGAVTFSVYNILGQENLSTRVIVPEGRSKHHIALPQRLVGGVYFLKAEMALKSVVRKFVVVE